MQIVSIFLIFLRLGCISFGGPAAHIAYFEREFVQTRQWLTPEQYAQMVALCQFLPGPASSQVGFSIGLERAGVLGAIAAFIGFTLPSFLLMVALVFGAAEFLGQSWFMGVMHGLKLLAVVVVVDAVWSMSQKFCANNITLGIAVLTASLMVLFPNIAMQFAVLITAGVVGAWFHQKTDQQVTTQKPIVWGWLVLFAVLWLIPSLLPNEFFTLWQSFYQSGSLVFGGGHVVMPLLQQSLGGDLDSDNLLLAYSAAQAVPGPMFTMATYLGGVLLPATPLVGATLATLAIFMPGFLLVLALQKSWLAFSTKPMVSGVVTGVNASVVGLLLAALYSPIFVTTVQKPVDMVVVLLGVFLLRVIKCPLLLLVCGGIVLGLVVG